MKSLALHREQVCEGEKATLKCPLKTQIFIENAFFGRLLPSTELCPANEKSNSKKKKPKEKILAWEERYEDISCDVSNAKDKITEKCQTSRKCKVTASPQYFGQDPCPTTSKYLQVAYRCKPSQFNTESFCQNTGMQLQCGKKRIALFAAIFGATAGNPICSTSLETLPSYDCTVNVLSEVADLCQSQSSCNVTVSDSLFKNPCPYNVNTYLTVTYSCVKEGVFNSDGDAASDYNSEPEAPILPKPSESPKPVRTHIDDNHIGEDSSSTDIVTTPATVDKSSNRVTYSSSPKREQSRSSANSRMNDGMMASKGFAPIEESAEEYDFAFYPGGGRHVPSTQSTLIPPIRRTPMPTCLPPSIPNAVGISIHGWIATWDYIQTNKEKFILYFCLGVTLGLSMVLFSILLQFCCCKAESRRTSPAKAQNGSMRNGHLKSSDDQYGTQQLFAEEVTRMEMGEYGRDGNFLRFNHLTPPNHTNTLNFYS